MGKDVFIAEYYDPPYVDEKSSIFHDIVKVLQKDLNENWKFQMFKSEKLALECVDQGKCLFTLSGFENGFSLSYPAFAESFLVISKDSRGSYLKDLVWQFLVLVFTIFIPVLIIFSHYNLFFETGKETYNSRIFEAILLNFSIRDLKRPFSKVWASVTWIFLIFVMLLIIADLSSIISSANAYNSSLWSGEKSEFCSSFDILTADTVETVEKCLKGLDSSEFSHLVLGKLQISLMSRKKLQKFIIRDSSIAPHLFHLAFKDGTDTSIYDSRLKEYWKTRMVESIYSKYSLDSFKPLSNYSLFFQDFYVVFAGASFLVFFAGLLLVFRCVQRNHKSGKKLDSSEPSPSSRSLLNRVPSNTLSLDQSGVNHASISRPEEWINRAVDIQDENAHKFRNIQDYENELSAVEPVHGSNMTERSLLSMMKSSVK